MDPETTLKDGEMSDETIEEEVMEDVLLEDEVIDSVDEIPEEQAVDGEPAPAKDKALDNFLNDKITDYSVIGKKAGRKNITSGKNLDKIRGIRIGIAGKDDILELSHGEVLISETINYRTQRPER